MTITAYSCYFYAVRVQLLHTCMSAFFSNLRLFPARDLGSNGKPTQSEIVHVSINATGSRVINTRTDRSIRIWRSTVSLTDPIVIENPHRGPVTCISWNPATETSFASVGGDGAVKLWKGLGHLEREIKLGKTAAHLVAYAPDGDVMAVVADGSIFIYNVAKGYTKIAHDSRPSKINALQWTNKGHNVFATGHDDGSICFWRLDLMAIELLYTLQGHHSPVTCMCLDPRGRYLACGLREGIVSLWNTTDFTNLGVLSAVDRAISSLSASRDGTYLAVGYSEGADVKIYEYDTLTEVHNAPKSQAGKIGGQAAWFPNRTALIIVVDKGQVMLLAKKEVS